RLATYVSTHTTSTDKIWIFGEEPGVYWRSNRLPASRYIYSLLFTSGVISQEELLKMSTFIASEKPLLIIVERFDTLTFRGKPETSESLLRTDSVFSPIREVLQNAYSITDTICENFIMYRRR